MMQTWTELSRRKSTHLFRLKNHVIVDLDSWNLNNVKICRVKENAIKHCVCFFTIEQKKNVIINKKQQHKHQQQHPCIKSNIYNLI